jgi:N-acetylmuramoyl-L-alanine amidase
MRFKVKKTLIFFKRNVLMRYLAILLTPVLALLPPTKQSNANFNATLTVPVSGDKGTTNVENDATEYHIKKVVIDAGHGGKDSGCESSVGMEKKNTLAIALKLGQKMKEAYPNIEIIYTRDKDEFIELHRRADIANKAKADLFISIHCNSSDQGQPMGTETYVLGAHKMEENFNVAKRENASILLENDYQQQYDGFDPNTNEAYIIFSLYQNAYLDKSILFGKFVEQSLKDNAGRRSFGVKQAGFVVLRQTAMPSVLIETGFLNNMTEGAFISSEGGQETLAESIFLAFAKYKAAVETKELKMVKSAILPNTEGVIYKIQLATSSKDVSQTAKWKNVEDLEVTKEGNIYKYFKTGLETYTDASTALKKMRTSGFPDAFIVVYKNGKRVNLDDYK